MISKLVMIGSVALLTASFVIRRKETHFKDFYNDI